MSPSPFLRGCIDGDGSIIVYTDRSQISKNERYVSERLWISLVSASPTFIEWMRDTVARLRGIRARKFLDVLGRAARRGSGRPRAGWLYNEAPRGERAGVSELAYDTVSKTVARKGLGVRIPSPAPFPRPAIP